MSTRPTAVTLILRARGLDGLLTALPALRAVRAARPHHRLVLAAPGWLRPIVELTGCVDGLHATHMLGDLRWNAPPPTSAINLHDAGPDSITDLLGTDPEQLISYKHPDFPYMRGPTWPAHVHDTVRWCRLLESAGIPADPTDYAIAPPVEALGLRSHIVIHPGAPAARRWPAERFARVAAALIDTGYPILVTGDAAEVGLAHAVAEAAGLPRRCVVAGELTVRQLAATIAGAALLVAGDTGVGHLATAFGTHSVLVFGPASPDRAAPPPHRDANTALWAGRVGDIDALDPDPGLLLVTEDQVIHAARRQLEATRRETVMVADAG
ncbi:glycosyltransferase family 9 protein [Nocardia bovistercoris]|uniref:Glycosyltransferase family 9 protein n=1 Tax=Nocardia bovistercoris TaxID=2785916 RepID=A0A931N3A5_9NOCA|nr:glycosyltransferase family 9 protein [Nocardia bovistercoris]MBH0780410.1 glycosyltransferase family 9 protein [Nocardia bovistercoris]